MSGRKQHFIPQSLLRGFGTHKGKKTYAFAYTYNRGIFGAPTDGIGAERNFYSELDVEGAIETLDDKITDYEQQIPAVLEQLRQISPEDDPAIASELVAHLTVRNDHFRKAASTGGVDLVKGMTDVLSNEDSARFLMGIAGDRPSELFATQLPELWEQFGPMFRAMGMTEAQFNEFAFQALKAKFSAFLAEMVGPLRDAFCGMVEKVPEVAATAQRRALTESLSPPKRIDRLAKFRWQTVETMKPVILPDCIAVGVDADSGTLPLMLADLDKTHTVYMPLATNRMLLGSLENTPAVPQDVNEVFANCSWDFFVARDRTPELEAHRGLLRTTSNSFMSGTVDDVIAQSLAMNRP